MAACKTDKENIGFTRCNALMSLPQQMIETPPDFKLTPAQAADPLVWQALLLDAKSKRGYLWPEFASVEDVSEDAIYEETALTDIAVRDGKYRYRVGIAKDLCTHKAMYTHRGSGMRIFIKDNKNQLNGTEDADGNIRGFRLALLHTEKLKVSDGSVASKSPIYIVLADNSELDERGVIIDGSFINTLSPLTDVTILVNALLTDSDTIVVAVSAVCDGTPISGLVKADFTVKTPAGVTQSILTVVETDDGVYTLTATTSFVTGTVNLVSAGTLTVEGFESVKAVTVTIP